MKENNKYILGLDIGVGSVGWGITDHQGRVINTGVELFSSGLADGNKNRRIARGSRRLARRKKYRKSRLDWLFQQAGVKIAKDENLLNVVELRCKGLTEKLSEIELYNVLRSMLGHRGITYLDELEEAKDTDYGKLVEKNIKILGKEEYPCKVQRSRLEKYGEYKGLIEDLLTGELYNNVFTQDSYVKEVKKILETNKDYHQFLTEEFISSYLDLLTNKRHFSQGPGCEKSRSSYGVYRLERDEDGNYIKWDNIFVNMVGKCSIYEDELRASGASISAEIFNCLNDLNNISIDGEKMSIDMKQKVFMYIWEQNSNVTVKQVKDYINKLQDGDITGLRENKKRTEELVHTLPVFHTIKKKLIELNMYTRQEVATKLSFNSYLERDIQWDLYDDVMFQLKVNTEKELIEKALRELGVEDKYFELLLDIRTNKSTLFGKYHSLSLKAQREIIPQLYNTQQEQQGVITRMGLGLKRLEMYKGCNSLPIDEIVKDITNPVVKKAVRVAFKLITRLEKEYGTFDEIVIEMARESNSKEAKKAIEAQQKERVVKKERANKAFEEALGRELKDSDYYNNKGLWFKILLWYNQGGLCVYTGNKIDVERLVNNPYSYEIDHIIPISISFDDSQANKVLVEREANTQKGNKTSYEYLKDKSDWDFKAMQKYVKANVEDKEKKKGTIPKKTADLLMNKEKVSKYEVVQDFRSRNLNDTRYASKQVLNALQGYYKVNNKDTKVSVLKGVYTNQFRVRLNLPKNREESYAHHGVDALICCYAKLGLLRYTETKEYTEVMEELFFTSDLKDIKEKLERASKTMQYSYKEERKKNRQVSDLTIYSTRVIDGQEYKVSKLNLYTDADVLRFKKLYEKDKSVFLLAKSKGFAIIDEIVAKYGFTKVSEKTGKEVFRNPFMQYKKENKRGIYDGVEIKNLRYIDGKYTRGLDITHKYGKGNRVFLSGVVPYSLDIYYSEANKKYVTIRINHVDYKWSKDGYKVSEEVYLSKLSDKYAWDELEYVCTLYPNSIVKIDNGKEVTGEYRVGSFGKSADGNTLVLKPIDRKDFDKTLAVTVTTLVHLEKVGF